MGAAAVTLRYVCGTRSSAAGAFRRRGARASVGPGVETPTRPRVWGSAQHPTVHYAPHPAPLCRQRGGLESRSARQLALFRGEDILGHPFKF